LEVAPDDADDAIGLVVDQDDTGSTDAVNIENAGTGEALFINQDGEGISLSFDSEATTADIVEIDADTLTTGELFDIELAALTTGNVMDIDLSADTINTGVALINVTGTALNTATEVRLLELSTTAANDVDVTVAHIERGTDDARITFDEGSNEWQLDQGTGSGLVAITTGAAGANTALSNLASVAVSESLISDTDNTDDLGSSSKEWKDLYIDGVAYIDAVGETLASDTDSTDDLGSSSIAWANLYADNILTVSGNNLTLKGAGASDEIVLQPDNDTDDYLTFAAVSNVPVIYGTGAYVSIGDAATTSQSLDAEDDLLVTGDAEVDGAVYVDVAGDSDFGANVTVDTGNKFILDDDDTEDSYLLHDTTNNWVEVWCDNAEVMHFEADGDVAIAKDKKYILDSDDGSNSYVTFASASTRIEFYVDNNLAAYLDADGKLYVDDTGAGSAAQVDLYDAYDDIALLKAYVYGQYDQLPESIITKDGFVDERNLKQLISGAIFQMDERLRRVEEQLAQR